MRYSGERPTDVPAILRNDLARALGVPPATLVPKREIVKINLEDVPRVGLECALGELQRHAREAFVPLVVRQVTLSLT